MLEGMDLLSVNQLAGQIKLVEAWKAMNTLDYPVKLKKDEGETNGENTRYLRPSSVRDMKEGGMTKSAERSFVRDTGRLWNNASKDIKEAKSLRDAKQKIRSYCKTLPI